MKRYSILLVAGMMATLAIAGCGGSTPPPATSPTITAAPAPAPTTKGGKREKPKAMLGPEGIVE